MDSPRDAGSLPRTQDQAQDALVAEGRRDALQGLEAETLAGAINNFAAALHELGRAIADEQTKARAWLR